MALFFVQAYTSNEKHTAVVVRESKTKQRLKKFPSLALRNRPFNE